jgi:hypothetical protein
MFNCNSVCHMLIKLCARHHSLGSGALLGPQTIHIANPRSICVRPNHHNHRARSTPLRETINTMASSSSSPKLHVLMKASYTNVQELPDKNTRLTGKPVAYFLTRDTAVKFINTKRSASESGGGIDIIREIQQSGDGQAYGVAYSGNEEKRGLDWWIHSDIRGHTENSADVLGFVGRLTTRFGCG